MIFAFLTWSFIALLDRLTSSSLFLFLSLIFLSFPSILNIHSILFLNLTICGFSEAESIYESVVIVLNFLRELFVSFSGDAKPVWIRRLALLDWKSQIYLKTFLEFAMSRTAHVRFLCRLQEYLKIYHGDEYVKVIIYLFCIISPHSMFAKIAFLLTSHQPQTFHIYCTWNPFSRWPNHNNLLQ